MGVFGPEESRTEEARNTQIRQVTGSGLHFVKPIKANPRKGMNLTSQGVCA